MLWTIDTTFTLVAAFAQAVLGCVFLIRRGPSWGWIVGPMFLLNAAIAISRFVKDGEVGAFKDLGSLDYVFDPLTSYLILLLVLLFPKVPKPFVGREKWVIGAILTVALVHFSSAFWLPAIEGGRVGPGWGGAVYRSGIQQIAWAAVLVRWSRVILDDVDWKFGLLACAFVVRAAHLGLLSLGSTLWGTPNLQGAIQTYEFAWDLVHFFALGYAIVILVIGPKTPTSHAPAIFLTFIAIGVVESMFSLPNLVNTQWANSPFVYLDLLVFRPVLVWGSLYGLPTNRGERTFAIAILALLAASAFVPATNAFLADLAVGGGVAKVLVGRFFAVLAAVAVWMLIPLLREEAWRLRERKLAVRARVP